MTFMILAMTAALAVIIYRTQERFAVLRLVVSLTPKGVGQEGPASSEAGFVKMGGAKAPHVFKNHARSARRRCAQKRVAHRRANGGGAR